MQVKNRRQEKVCVSNLNFAFFKKEEKGKGNAKNPLDTQQDVGMLSMPGNLVY